MEREDLFWTPYVLEFAKDKFIKGKVDKGKHDGRASNVRREQQSLQHLKENPPKKSK